MTIYQFPHYFYTIKKQDMKTLCSKPDLTDKQLSQTASLMATLYNLETPAELDQHDIEEMIWGYLNNKGWIHKMVEPHLWITEWVDRCNRLDVDEDIAKQMYDDICQEIETKSEGWLDEESDFYNN